MGINSCNNINYYYGQASTQMKEVFGTDNVLFMIKNIFCIKSDNMRNSDGRKILIGQLTEFLHSNLKNLFCK